MNTISKKLLTGTLSAAVLFGAAGWMEGSFAAAVDTSSTSSAAATTEETTTPDATTEGTTKSFDGRGHHRHGGHGGKGHHGRYANSADLATILGITEEELKAEREAGKTLVEIAEAHGMTEDGLINALKDGLTNELKDYVNSVKPAKPEKSTTDNGTTSDTTAEVEA